MMNRFFTLLLAASCLTAVGQDDCMISEEELWGFSIGGGSFECLGDGGIESVAYQVVLFPNGVIVQTTYDYSCEVGVWEFSPFTCSYSISGMYVYDECHEFLQCVLESGCLDQEACNYDPEAEFHDGSCLYLDDCGVCGGQSQSGCSNANACNYCEEGECEFPSCGCDCEGDCLSGEATILFYPIGGCDLEYPPTEFYLPNAELSCLFSNGNADGDFAEGDSCQLYLNGNLVFEGIPGDYYGPQVGYGTLLQPYLTPENFPCGIDTLVFKFPRPNNDTLTLTGFWSPEHPFCGDLSYLSGCTDIEAINFSSDFLCDDGSCIYLGCTDPMSCNFDVTANSDDGSCDYGCCPGPGCCGEGMFWDWNLGKCAITNPSDSNFDGCVQLNDLLDLLSAYGNCGAEELAWQCGDPLEYQGYDYQTVQIGEQCWFAENLRAENYRNGENIPHGESNWSTTTEGAKDFGPIGVSYNGFAVLDGRQLCPNQWHVSLDTDWVEMETLLGMDDANEFGWRGTNQGTVLKATSGWSGGISGTDAVGFSAIQESHKQTSGSYRNDLAIWWCPQAESLISRNLNPTDERVYRNQGQLLNDGLSIRCIKD